MAGRIDVTSAPYGADSTGNRDATAAIQAAATAAAGGELFFPPNSTFKVSAGIQLPPTLRHVIGYGATIVPVPYAQFTPRANGWYSVLWMDCPTLTQVGIVIEGLTISSPSEWGGHAINIRGAIGVLVRDVISNFISDCVALVGCSHTTIDSCMAYGAVNCAFDHWGWPGLGGPQNARVLNCFGSGNSIDVNFNAASTSADALSFNGGLVDDCTFVGSTVVSIYGAPLAPGSSVNTVTVRGCRFIAAAGLAKPGIAFQGVTGAKIIDNSFEQFSNSPVEVQSAQANGAQPSSYVDVMGNYLIAANMPTKTLITLSGAHHTASGNKAMNCSANIGIMVDDQSTTVALNDMTGCTYPTANMHPWGGATTPAMEVEATSGYWVFKQKISSP